MIQREYKTVLEGVGKAMHEAVEELAKANNIKLLVAGVHAQNTDSQVFHDEMGFSIEPSPDGSENRQ